MKMSGETEDSPGVASIGDVPMEDRENGVANPPKLKEPEPEDKMETEEEALSPTTGDAASDINLWTSIKCVFCDHILTSSDNPKLLECLHAACAACISSKLNDLSQMDAEVVENNTVVCPRCSVHCHSSNIIDNQFVLDFGTDADTKNVLDVVCTSCHDNAPATKWCVECAEFICDGCVQAHQRLKITKDHTIKAKEDAEQVDQASASTSGPRSLYCSTHRQERLTLFCESCDQLTCRDCQLSDHRDHKYKFNHEIAALTKSQITSLLSEVSYKRVLLTSAMKVIDERQTLIVDKKKTLVKDITNLVVRLTNAINLRGKQLVAHMNHVCDSKQKTLQEKKKALEQLSDLTDHCITFVEGALSKGSDMALLYSKKVVTNHLQRIKSRRADIPNPEIPVRIHLTLDKVPELVKVLSAVGGIVVDGRLYSSFLASVPPQQPSPIPTGQAQPAVTAQASPTASPLLRHPIPQVTSSTHPTTGEPTVPTTVTATATPTLSDHLRQPPPANLRLPRPPYATVVPGDRINLRGLLGAQQAQGLVRFTMNQQLVHNPPTYNVALGQRFPRLTTQQQAQLIQQQQFYNRMPQQQHQVVFNRQPGPAVQWHIPQQAQGFAGGQVHRMVCSNGQLIPAGSMRAQLPMSIQPVNDSYKITLKSQPAVAPIVDPVSNKMAATPVVTSTIPKTPSPSQGKPEDAETSLDKFCQESVNDLMATIAKLDRNGIEVRPESKEGAQVDSSTGQDRSTPGLSSTSLDAKNSEEFLGPIKDDPNDDWCAVCLDGGELVCCDNCPKVFHVNCHIPTLAAIPEESESWQCLMCTNVLNSEVSACKPGDKRSAGLTPTEQRLAERIVLELYCQYDHSLPFREVVGPEVTEYHEKIKHPMSLDIVRKRLDRNSPDKYTSLSQLIRDVRRMFKNAYIFNNRDSQVFRFARTLEDFLDHLLEKWLPFFAYSGHGSDSDSEASARKYRKILPLPEGE